MNWSTLVSAEEVSQCLGDNNLVIIDARFVLSDASAGEKAWQASHIANAHYWHLDRDLSDKSKPAHWGRHPLPEAKNFCDVLIRTGISKNSQVVIYDANDGAMAAARAWYLLQLLGHKNSAVLDGGFSRWCELTLPVDNKTPVSAKSDYRAEYDLGMLVSAASIKDNIDSKMFALIDARAAERYRGDVEPIDKKAGHIPGAINRPYGLNVENGRFRNPKILKQEFLQLLGNKQASETILYCGSGVTACHNLLAMEVAGLPGARIYSPSWSGWINEPQNLP